MAAALHVALVSWVPRPYVGGVESFLHLLAERLIRSDIRVTLVGPPSDAAEGLVQGAGVWEHRGLLRNDSTNPKLADEFAVDFDSFLVRERVSLVHSHNLHIPMAPGIARAIERVSRSRSVPHLLTVHDVTEYRGANRELTQLQFTIIATQSDFNERRIRITSGLPVERLPVGVDFASYDVTPTCEPRTVAALGRFTAAKGVHEILCELSRVASPGDPIRVILSDRNRPAVGRSGTYIKELELVSRRSPGLTLDFLHGDDPVPNVYKRAALTVVRPNVPEGFGLVALESLASGRPVVTIPTGGMTEWICSLPGVFCVPDSGDIGQAVTAVLQDWPSWHSGAICAREALRSRFDAGVVLQKHLHVYHRLTGD